MRKSNKFHISINHQSGVIVLSATILISLVLLTVLLIHKKSLTANKFVALSGNYLRVTEAGEHGIQNAIDFIDSHSKNPYLRNASMTENNNRDRYYRNGDSSLGPNTNVIWISTELAKHLKSPTTIVSFSGTRDKSFDDNAIKISLADDILTHTIIEDMEMVLPLTWL